MKNHYWRKKNRQFSKTYIQAGQVENALAFRSWAHVKWESVTELLDLIEDFEKIVDNAK